MTPFASATEGSTETNANTKNKIRAAQINLIVLTGVSAKNLKLQNTASAQRAMKEASVK